MGGLGKAIAPVLALVLLVTSFLAACAPAATPTPTTAPAPTKAPAAAPTKAAAPEATKPAAPAATKPAEPTKPAAAAPAGPAAVVKISHTPSLQFGPLYVADAKGYFKEQGITISFENTAGAADVAAFLGTGQLDAVAGSISAGFFNALNRGVEVRIVGPLAVEPPVGGGSMSPLLVRKDLADKGEVKTVKDLKGKTVSINTRSGISEYRLSYVLKQAGMNMADVEIVTLGFPEQLTALQNGAIAAAISTMPFAPQAVSMGIAKILVDETLPGQMTFTIQYGGKFIQERPDVARKFMLATLKGSRDLQDKGMLKPDLMDIVSKATGQKPEIIKAGVLPVYDPDGKIQTDFIEGQQQFFKDIGKLEYQEMKPLSKLVDDTFVKYAVQQLGPYKK